jgi:hypothetical protein
MSHGCRQLVTQGTAFGAQRRSGQALTVVRRGTTAGSVAGTGQLDGTLHDGARIALRRSKSWGDSQAALECLQHNLPGLGEIWVIQAPRDSQRPNPARLQEYYSMGAWTPRYTRK